MRNFVTVVCHTFETLSIATRVVKSERAVYVTRSMYARRERVPSRVVGFTHVSYYLPFELDAIERTDTRAHAHTCARTRPTTSLSRPREPLRPTVTPGTYDAPAETRQIGESIST